MNLPDGGELRKQDFWRAENRRYANPHFRLVKCARLVNRIAGGAECDLLDVGCGPAALRHLLDPGVRYHGIDIAIQEPGPDLIETDFLEQPIGFAGRTFDLVVAQGVFEYVGDQQAAKFAEIRGVLAAGGTFIASYVNFGHRRRHLYEPYNNVQPVERFRAGLAEHFVVRRWFPTSHNWAHSEPNRRVLKAIQLPLTLRIPAVSPRLAVEYLFVCSPRPAS
jgi:SAM-dependent methyltransferase